ncbi:site-specific DNA-methyltransferase [Ruminococcus bromii]|jgi:adenine-specific DNA-methyltransferase|uniref:site-specific DNA-methyltransferase n=1 Tax=Ruminococcus bromii TaxID=40518 RepID=UPI003FD8639A
MDKLRMQTANKADENFRKLAEMFPNAVTETINENGEAVRAIDKDVLMQEIACTVVDGNEERYQFTWPDKKKSVLLANAPINKTLRPVREDETVPTGADGEGKPYCSTGSVDFDTTENLYIEGDNLEVLKLLQETYLGKIKMIYIDPPYNTGSDFVYEDDFVQSADEYLANSGQYDKDGNRLAPNPESNGRFHTDWLNMIYPRLKLAKDLLTDDGVIFISIDDNEQENLKKCCDEVFGGQNFVAQLVWERAYAPKNDARFISNSHDYVLMYARNLDGFVIGRLPRTEEANARYQNPDNDPRGVWKPSDLSVKTYNAACDYPITTPSGRVIEPPAGRCWRLSKNAFLERLQDNRIYFGADGNSVPCMKRFLTELKYDGMAPTSIMFYKDVGHSQEGAKEVTKLLNAGVFDGPKPVRLLTRLLTLANLKDDSLVLDFFSGSATTAHAIMQMNADKGSHIKYVMVQLPEVCDGKGTAYKAGYKTICEIGKERIRRAGKKIKEDSPLTTQDLDIGFRVLKCDTSNMKEVYYNPAEYEASLFSSLEDNIKEDRTPEDLLFQVMLDLGVLLSSKIKETTIAGKKVFNVEDNYLIACFDSDVTEETITAIAKQKPYYFVMRDSSMASDSVATNFDQIFATYSPDTVRKVL